MLAVLLTQIDGITMPSLSTIDKPELVAGSVRVCVRAASVNRADLLMRAGTHIPAAGGGDAPAVAGLDACGDVIEVAPDVTDVAVGNRVMAMVSGGLAEEVIVPAAAVVPVPSSWSYAEGAAAVVALMTEHNALVAAGRLRAGESVLVHAAAAGVATQAISLAKVLGAGRVYGTVRSNRHREVLERLGVDELIDVTEADFADRTTELTDGLGIDVVLDHVGGPYLEQNLRAAAIGGRIVGVGRLGGSVGSLDMEELARKRVEVVGVTFRTRTDTDKFDIVRALRTVDLEENAAVLRPVIHGVHSWHDVVDVQDQLAENKHAGKLVLQVL
ncbi:zinc-binding dehydrogenase [Rhodococcoides fascians]|uniref:zinc-binding dehydrogenase n=1 Tax=Rhodococcoides fascians TaxID=1828 RepID=UPI00055E091A|nr:zinc-binding dehydrogenase [Rhodococcus fascians]